MRGRRGRLPRRRRRRRRGRPFRRTAGPGTRLHHLYLSESPRLWASIVTVLGGRGLVVGEHPLLSRQILRDASNRLFVYSAPTLMTTLANWDLELPWGAHVCHFFSTYAEQKEVVLPFLLHGLQANENCLFTTCDHSPDDWFFELQAYG